MKFSFASFPGRRRERLAAMSILELLAVIAIISTMVVFGATSMDGLFRGTGRRAAVEKVLGMLEQGRMKALASGRSVYVVFADATCPEEQRWRAMAIYEEGEDPGSPLVAATPWVTLPGRMKFGHGLATPSITDAPVEVDTRLFMTPGGERALPYLKFNPAGGVDYPTHGAAAHLYLGWNGGGEIDLGRGYETVRVALFTGRAMFLAGQGVPEVTTAGVAGSPAY